MKFAGLFALGLLAASGTVRAEPLPVDRDKVWFKPTLTVNVAPICADILGVEQDIFFAARARDSSAYADLQLIGRDSGNDAELRVEVTGSGHARQWKLTRPKGQQVFVRFERFGGCGSACETERVQVSDKQFDPPGPFREERTSPGTPRSPEWNLYKGPDGEFYALGIVDHDRSQAYRLASGGSVDLVCEVPLKPDKLSDNADPAIRRAWQSVEALNKAYYSVSQGAGNCGTLRTHDRHQRYAAEAMAAALYRPWGHRKDDDPAFVPTEVPRWSLDQQLETWALGGIAEYQAWQHYRARVQQTVNELAGFYGQKFAWPETEARKQAARVVHDALDAGFSFSSYYDYDVATGDRPLRRAILERQPLADMKQHEVAALGIRSEDQGDRYDSILNVAIQYPEALQYLLSKGLDPNAANDFGKTPLMYAAQYNQLESVRILLAAGADPNATTYLPEDDCYYVLSTSGMTPLHYAVRYASAEVVRTLLANQAVTFAKTQKTFPDAEEYPLDWLKKHTGTAPEVEQNPNISAAEAPALSEALRVPSDADRRHVSVAHLMRSRAEYASGDVEGAYRSLRVALLAQPENDKAVADLPLVAFKAGEIREAVIAARRAIAVLTQESLQASAWFNLGLICEQEEIRKKHFRRDQCGEDWILPFVTAWDLQPTRGRVAKLREIFQRNGSITCLTSRGEVGQRIWKGGKYHGARIHILHQLEDQVDIASSPGFKLLVDGIPMQELAITVLERTDNNDLLPTINGQACRTPEIQPPG